MVAEPAQGFVEAAHVAEVKTLFHLLDQPLQPLRCNSDQQ